MLQKVIKLLNEELKQTCGAGCPVGSDEGDRCALHERTTKVGWVGDVWDTEEPRRDEEFPRTGARWTEDSKMV